MGRCYRQSRRGVPGNARPTRRVVPYRSPAPTMPDLAPILDSPALPALVERLQRTLSDEAERRAAFREALTPDQKAEFINGETIVHSPARARHIDATDRVLMAAPRVRPGPRPRPGLL